VGYSFYSIGIAHIIYSHNVKCHRMV